MSLPHLSLADARNLHLAAQGLLNKPRRQASLRIFRQRSPACPAANRLPSILLPVVHIWCFSVVWEIHPAQWLDESLARGELMEYWAHEACFMPRSDFRLIRHRMLAPEKWAGKYKDALDAGTQVKLHS